MLEIFTAFLLGVIAGAVGVIVIALNSAGDDNS